MTQLFFSIALHSFCRSSRYSLWHISVCKATGKSSCRSRKFELRVYATTKDRFWNSVALMYCFPLTRSLCKAHSTVFVKLVVQIGAIATQWQLILVATLSWYVINIFIRVEIFETLGHLWIQLLQHFLRLFGRAFHPELNSRVWQFLTAYSATFAKNFSHKLLLILEWILALFQIYILRPKVSSI